MSEPHRFTSIMTCLASVARQIVRQTPHFSEGQTYVLQLLMAVLPGIDSNDFKKTAVTFQFLNAILMLVTCVDCSSAVNTRSDLTEVNVSLVPRPTSTILSCRVDRDKSVLVHRQLRRFHH